MIKNSLAVTGATPGGDHVAVLLQVISCARENNAMKLIDKSRPELSYRERVERTQFFSKALKIKYRLIESALKGNRDRLN